MNAQLLFPAPPHATPFRIENRRPALPAPGIYTKGWKSRSRSGSCTIRLTAVLFAIAKVWKQWNVHDRKMDRADVVYTHTVECYSALRKKGILSHVTTWKDSLKDIPLSEISRSQEDTHLHGSVYRGHPNPSAAESGWRLPGPGAGQGGAAGHRV